MKTLDKIFDHIDFLICDYMVDMALHVFILMKNAIKDMNEHRIVPLSLDLTEVNLKLMDSHTLDQMKCILLEVYRKINTNNRNPDQERNEVLVDTIKAIIEQNYADIGIGDSMKLSPDYIGKMLKKHQGIPVAEYIYEVRLLQIVLCLEEGD